ncbi:MAG: hypothetical protein K2J13_00830 [Clostridia bacterium]|nr:hypothetical protein [Clostridia bacterium]
MKKKIFVITSIMLIIVALCSMFVGCKSAEEKEKEYYEKNAKAVEKATDTLSTLTDKVFEHAWTSSFVLAMTYYKTDSEKKYDGSDEVEKSTKGSISESSIQRGSKEEAGWPVKEVRNEEEKYTIKNSTNQYVFFMAFDVDFKSLDNYSVKTTTFKDVKRSDYINNIGKKKYREKFEIEKEFEYKFENGEYKFENYADEAIYMIMFDPINIIKSYTDKESLRETGISASDNFRIYTHFMRIESRTVIGKDNDGNMQYVTRELNDASDKMYWTNYGDDISYNWDNVYRMTNNRLTVLYSKGKERINSLEIYNEEILSYYTKNNNVDTSLVLKADVVAFTEMVVDFKYAK